MKKTYYFVRHGASTADSGEMQLHGINAPATVEDIPLAEMGKEEAERAGDFFKRLGTIDAVYTSPLARTYDTAAIIAKKLGLEVRTIPEVREVNLTGVLNFFKKRTGKSPIKINTADIPNDLYRGTMMFTSTFLFSVWMAGNVPDCETPDEVGARLEEGFRQLSEIPHNNIVVVSHGFFLTYLAYHFVKNDFSQLSGLRGRFWVPNCSITKITDDNGKMNLRYFARDDYRKLS